MLFTPEAGYTGRRWLRCVADDGANVSAEATIPITISGASLVSLEIQNRLPRLDVGGLGSVVVVGDFADQPDVELDPHYVTFASSAPSVFSVTDEWPVAGVHRGTGVLTVSRGALRRHGGECRSTERRAWGCTSTRSAWKSIRSPWPCRSPVASGSCWSASVRVTHSGHPRRRAQYMW